MKTATIISNAIDVSNVLPEDLDDASNTVIKRMNIEGGSFDESGFTFDGNTDFEVKREIGKQFGYTISDDSEDENLLLKAIDSKYIQLLENELRFRGLL